MNGADARAVRPSGRAGTHLWLLTGCDLVSTGIALVLPLLFGRTIDAIVRADGAGWWAGLVGVALGCAVLCEAADAILRTACIAGTTARVRRGLVAHVIAAGPRHGFAPGDLLSRVASNAPDAAQAGPARIGTITAAAPPVGSLVLLALIDPWLAVAFLAGLGLVALVLRAFTRGTADAVAGYQAVQNQIAARLVEALAGGRSIAAAGTQDAERHRILRRLPELHAQGRRTWRVLSTSTAQATLIGPLVLVSVLAAAGLELLRGRVSAGEVFAAGQYASLGMGLGALTGVLGQLARARAGAQRVAAVHDAPAVRHGGSVLPAGPGELEFRGVSVHTDGVTVLYDVDLVIPGGAAVAVVGESGSGKSVLAALAARLRDPDRGMVLLDGLPLPMLRHDALRAEIGCAFERPVLVGGTVGRALCPEGDDHRAMRLATATGVHPVIATLPRGYATPLDDAPMSGGEIQRIGLARAWDAGRLLVLDDAMSSVDTVTELRIARTLTQDHACRTRLIVTHRASTAARAELVVWLERGRVRALAPHAVLCEHEEYRRLFT